MRPAGDGRPSCPLAPRGPPDGQAGARRSGARNRAPSRPRHRRARDTPDRRSRAREPHWDRPI